MEKNHRKTGTRYERIAGEYLMSNGYDRKRRGISGLL